jgi:hypothetical protein
MARTAKKTSRRGPSVTKTIAKRKKSLAKKTVTKTASDLRINALQIADGCKDIWDQREDLKAAQVALKGYATANSVTKSQLIYKKMSGKPVNIKFLED